jgi:hypothetical protein
MYRAAGPTWKISKPSGAEIREIHRTLPLTPLFLLEAMSMDLNQDMVALPAEAPPWDGINVRIWENVL